MGRKWDCLPGLLTDYRTTSVVGHQPCHIDGFFLGPFSIAWYQLSTSLLSPLVFHYPLSIAGDVPEAVTGVSSISVTSESVNVLHFRCMEKRC